MPIDSQKLNTIYNQLKELVGPQGAFVLFCAEPNGEDEDTQVRTLGPHTRVLGLIDLCGPITRDNLIQVFNNRMKKMPKEPD